MSSEAQPISPSQFAAAVRDLPLENLYAKVAEIQNSISHLERSNDELYEFLEEEGPDRISEEAIRDNKQVVWKMQERIDLIKVEVERRGQKWHEGGKPPSANGQPKTEEGFFSVDEREVRRELDEEVLDSDLDENVGLRL